MLTIVTRGVSPNIGNCQLTFLERRSIDYGRACAQHKAYEEVLQAMGAEVISLPAAIDLPDSVFVEDTATVLKELAVVGIPARASRQQEVSGVTATLEQYRSLKFLQPPATLEGGDVILDGRTIYVGRSTRTNQEGITQFRQIVEPYGYTVREVSVRNCLHLSTGASRLAPKTFIANADWIDVGAFPKCEVVRAVGSEPWGGNVLVIGETAVMPMSCPRTGMFLQSLGFAVQAVDISEFEKAEAGVTCLRLGFESEMTAAKRSTRIGYEQQDVQCARQGS
jgi:dimethylargininase